MLNKNRANRNARVCAATFGIIDRCSLRLDTHRGFVGKAGRGFLTATVALVVVLVCSPATSSAESAVATVAGDSTQVASAEVANTGEAGTLAYSGGYNGKIEFKTSDCGVMDGDLVMFQAPADSIEGITPEGAPLVTVEWDSKGKPLRVMFSLPDRAIFAASDHLGGIRAEHQHDQWTVTFKGVRVLSMTFFKDVHTIEEAGRVKQKKVILDGVLRCTKMI